MKHFGVIFIALALLLTMSAVIAQDDMTPSVTVSDQVSLDSTVTVADVVANGPGFIVIHKANEDGGTGPVMLRCVSMMPL